MDFLFKWLEFDPNQHMNELLAIEERRAKEKQRKAEEETKLAQKAAAATYVDTASSPIKPHAFPSLPEVVAANNFQKATMSADVTKTGDTQDPAEKILNLTQPSAPQSTSTDKSTVTEPKAKNEPDFHNAIRTYGNGCVTELEKLLENKTIDLTTPGEQNKTCLHLAASIDDEDLQPIALVKFLLSKNPDLINGQDNAGNTAAHLSLLPEYFNPKLCKELLESRTIDLNLLNKEKQTLLHLAISYVPTAKKNQETTAQIAAATEIATLLIKKGAGLAIQNKRGQTPLHLAIQYGKKELIKLLLDSNAPVNAVDHEGNRLIHYAVCYTQPDTIELLKKHAADLTAINHLGQNPLHYAIMIWNADWKEKKRTSKFDNLVLWATRDEKDIAEETVDKLFKLGKTFSLDTRDQYGWTPLHWACVTQHIGQNKSYMITLLKKRGANLLATTHEGNTPFVTAIIFGMPITIPNTNTSEKPIALAKHLLHQDKEQKQKQIQMPNVAGNTALHFAIIIRSDYQVATVEYLLSKNADPFKKNNNGHSPYDLVVALQTKVHGQTSLERESLQAIERKFQENAQYQSTIKPEMVHIAPGFILPEPLQDYQLPWYNLPKEPLQEKLDVSEKTPTQDAFFQEVKRLSLDAKKSASSIATDSSAWTEIQDPRVSNASLISESEIINNVAELSAEPASKSSFGK